MCTDADKDVGHVGKCPRSGTLGEVLPPCRDHDGSEHGIKGEGPAEGVSWCQAADDSTCIL